jgi:type II secretory pathway pseudopilin PulG
MRRRLQLGFSLLEATISLAILAYVLMGAVQAQSLPLLQNGIARRRMVAASIARDFVENAHRWQFNDVRIAPKANPALSPTAGANCEAPQNLPDSAIGNAFNPTTLAHYSALSFASQAQLNNGLTLGGTTYDGTAPSLLGTGRTYQLLWWSHFINIGTASVPCHAIQVNVVVRYETAKNVYKNLMTSFVKANPNAISPSGIPEQI